MSRIAVIGAPERALGFGLGGAEVWPARDASDARAAWSALDDEVEVVILTPEADAAVADLERPPRRICLVMPPWT